ncbi:predicted protein [Chaetoceros tenuissimus]|uniref:Uncharacterized protein n=1 Tax=Chaetoceros tenuissimus TaxID=426638 RepID=A0AAD3D0Z4_9STRA|nr:predicted protein [Chaetoceros tenuissimus]
MVNKIDLPKILLLWLVLGYTGDKAYRVQRDLNDQVQRKMTAKLGIESTETKPVEAVAKTEVKKNIKVDTDAKKVDVEEDKEEKKKVDAKPQEEGKEEPKLATTSEEKVADK